MKASISCWYRAFCDINMHKIILIVIAANKNDNEHHNKMNKFPIIIGFYHKIMKFCVIFIHLWLWQSWKWSLYLMFFIVWIVTMKALIMVLVRMIFIIFLKFGILVILIFVSWTLLIWWNICSTFGLCFFTFQI